MILWAVLALAAMLRAEPPPADSPAPILQFLHGIRDVADRQNTVLRDAAALARWWDPKKGAPPAIDFSKNVVLVAAMGPTSEHLNRRISIVTAAKTPSGALRAQVVLTEGEPLPLSDAEAKTIYPFCAIVVEKPAGPVVWAAMRKQELKIRGGVKGFDAYRQEATAVMCSAEDAKPYAAGASEAMPKVDFKRFTLLGAFRGKVPSTGYGIAIQAISMVDGELTVVVLQAAPPEGAPMAPIPGCPAHVVAVDRWDGPVRFAVSRAADAKAPQTGKDLRDVFNK